MKRTRRGASKETRENQESLWPWQGSSVSWSIVLIRQGCGFDPQSGCIQESTSDCIDQWNNEWIFLSPFLSLSKIKKKKPLEESLVPGPSHDNTSTQCLGVLGFAATSVSMAGCQLVPSARRDHGGLGTGSERDGPGPTLVELTPGRLLIWAFCLPRIIIH